MARHKAQNGVTLIAPNTQVVGDIRFHDQLFINGRVEGNVVAGDDGRDATVVISDEGSVKGEIRVPNVIINGEIEGDVYALSRLELAAGARVKGNVYYQLIEMQLGAMVDGQLLHEPGESASVHRFPGESGDSADSGAATRTAEQG